MAKKKKAAAPITASLDTAAADTKTENALDALAAILEKEVAAADTDITGTNPPPLTSETDNSPLPVSEPAPAPTPFASAQDPLSPLKAEPMTETERAAMLRDNAEYAFIESSKDNNPFVESLANVTADDLGKPPKKKKKDPIDMLIGLVRQAIFWIAVVVFFVSGYQVVYKLYAYQQAEDIYDIDFESMMQRREDLVPTALRDNRLSTLVPVNGTREETGTLSDAAENVEYNETFEIMKGQLMILRNKNEEIVGWIRIAGDTKIDYPIVQHSDNDYYLHYAYDGTYNPAGSIYLDYKNNTALSTNRHSILFGHNMESGSPMFSNLLHYREDGFWEKNRYIEIYTDNAFYTYEIFASYETSPSQTAIENHAWRMNFKKDDTIFMNWLDDLCARSDIKTDVPLDADSRILTLSTCMNINENRYVVHAVLVDTVK